MWYVDVPHPNREEWENIDMLDTEKAALAYAQERFGADEDGKICLVSFTEDDDRCPHGMFFTGAGACPKCREEP